MYFDRYGLCWKIQVAMSSISVENREILKFVGIIRQEIKIITAKKTY